MLAGERRCRFLILKGKHTGRTAVKSRFEGLTVRSDRGVMLQAGVYITVPHHKARLWL